MELKKYKLADIAEIVNGATPSTKDSDNYDGSIIWITPKDLSDQKQKYIKQGQRTITEKGFSSCSAQMIPPYNILMSSRAPIGLLAINQFECCTNQGFKNLVLDKSICDVNFIYYYLKFHIKEIESLGTGTTFKEVSKSSLQKFEIELPDIDIQRSIAKCLSAIDRKIALNRQTNATLEAMAKQLYDYWFVQFDFPNEEGKPYKSSGGVMVRNERIKRNIPANWHCCELNKWLEIKSGFAFKSETYISEGQYKVITIKNVQDHHLDTSSCDYVDEIPQGMKEWCRLSVNDRLISLTGNCGRLCIVTEKDLLLNQRVGLLSCDNEYIDYAYLLLSSDEYQILSANLAKGAAQANLSPIDLCNNISVLPNINVLRKFNTQVKPIVESYIQNEIQIAILTKQRDELLPLLMNGQATVNAD